MLPPTLADGSLPHGETPAYEFFTCYSQKICRFMGSAAVSSLKDHVHVDVVVGDVSVSGASDGKKKLEDKTSALILVRL